MFLPWEGSCSHTVVFFHFQPIFKNMRSLSVLSGFPEGRDRGNGSSDCRGFVEKICLIQIMRIARWMIFQRQKPKRYRVDVTDPATQANYPLPIEAFEGTGGLYKLHAAGLIGC